MKLDDQSKNLVPLLVGFSVQRTGDGTLPGQYDPRQQVWVIEDGNGVGPIVEAKGDICELATKTFAEPERDDVESVPFLEATTKTEARPERDDAPRSSLVSLLEMLTKTKTQQERDD